jgi:mannose/cellobiose epimerase-like protein (N-acyl-D-glucosamine 2-epimerase family)
MSIAAVPTNLSAWLAGQAWPLWLEHGVDWQTGAFHEALDPASLTCPATFRRLRVAARQTYVFSQAALAGIPRAEDAVALGIGFLRRHARQADGGYAWRFDLANAPVDQTRDLYDHAFVLLAYAHAAPVLPSAGLERDAAALLAYIDARFPHPTGGYRESLPDQTPRRQNSHMHLLEALLAAHEHFGGPDYIARAEGLVRLMLDRLMQQAEGALPEFFDAELLPLRDEGGRFAVEPGHHFEWVWLLDRHLRLSRAAGHATDEAAIEAAIATLMRHAEAHGIDAESGLVLDGIRSDGSVSERGFRLWPQTERLKAAACRPELARTGAAACMDMIHRYFESVPSGLWQERLEPGGLVHTGPAPASSLYHLTCAMVEAR